MKLAAIFIVVWGISAAAQQQPTFRSSVEMVVVQVKVADHQQRPVVDLTKEDFVLLENGTPQHVSHFVSAAGPLDIALLLDTSGSIQPILPNLRESALEFLNTLRPGDRGMVVGFDDGIRVLQGLSGDHQTLRDAIGRLRAGGSTSLFDGLYVTLKTLAAGSPDLTRRQAVVVLSDGKDTSSILSADDVYAQSIRSSVPIYMILLEDEAAPPQSYDKTMRRYQVMRLARDTGGTAFRIQDGPTLQQAYKSIAQELSQHYVLGYQGSPERRSGREPQIVVKIPSRPSALSRTHVGFMDRHDAGN